MKNILHVFGDSYVGPFPKKSWTDFVADRLNLDIVNYAIPGSSIEHSIIKFNNNKQLIKPGDRVIFSFSEPGRLHTLYTQQNPQTAWFNSSRDVFPWLQEQRPNDYELFYWHRDNLSNLQWFLSNRDIDIYHLNILAYTHMLKSFAENNPTINMLVLHMYKPVVNEEVKNLPNNFIVNDDFYLNEVSDNEYANGNADDLYKTYVYDPRMNHFTIPNRNLLIDYAVSKLSQCQTTISKESFYKGLLKISSDLKDYQQAINDGTLEFTQRIYDVLEKKSMLYLRYMQSEPKNNTN